jgi:hypothetical protein
MFRPILSSSVVKFLAKRLLSSVFAYVVKYIGPLDAHMFLNWCFLFSLVFCAAGLVLECMLCELVL